MIRSAYKRSAIAGAIGLGLAATSFAGKPPDCWMTGGGSIFDADREVTYSGRTTHGFVLHCDTRNPNRLEINWEDNRFHLTSLDSAMCPDTAGISPNPPDALFDTFIGIGTGVGDTAQITILDPEGWQVLSI